MIDEREYYRLGVLYRERKLSGKNKSGTRISYKIADEFHVNHATVERAERYADGIDAIREIDPELAEMILDNRIHVNKEVIHGIRKVGKDELAEFVRLARSVRTPVIRSFDGGIRVRRSDRNEVAGVVANIFAPSVPVEYGIDSFLRDIRNNSEPFVKLIKQMISVNRNLYERNRNAVADEIHGIILKIERLEEEIRNEQ